MKMQFRRALPCLFISGAIILCQQCPAYAYELNNAFDRSDSKLEESYRDAFSWDETKINADSWTDDNGNEHSRHSLGYQKEAFEDMLQALIAQLEQQGYQLDLTEGADDDTNSSKRAKGIVSIALGEVGKERSVEAPKGSNNVYYNTWFYGKEVSGDAYEWCMVFLSWCANECGYIDSGLFNKTMSCASLFSYLTNNQGFSYYSVSDLSQFGGSYESVAGDIVFWKSDNKLIHAGIITDTSSNSVDITQGNTSDRVCTVAYSKASLKNNKSLKDGYVVHVQYPSFSFDGANGEIQDTVYLFLTKEMGLSSAAACGLMGNFQVECGWNLDAVGDNGTSYGLCQWHDERWQRLMSYCASNGYDPGDIEGQLRYLEYELTSTSEGSVMAYLNSVSDSESGAVSAALSFAKYFERCTSDSYGLRQNYASYFWQIYGGK